MARMSPIEQKMMEFMRDEMARRSTPKPKSYNRYKIADALMNLGIWQEVKAWLQQNPDNWDRLVIAEDISADEPLLAEGIEALKSQFGVTQEQVDEILAGAEIGGA